MTQKVRAQGRGPDITTLCFCDGTEVKHKARNRMLPWCSGTSPNKESESYQTVYVTTQNTVLFQTKFYLNNGKISDSRNIEVLRKERL